MYAGGFVVLFRLGESEPYIRRDACHFPDYNGVVIPPNMAPLNFALDDQDAGSRAVFSFGGQQFEVKGEKGSIVIPPSKWKNLLESAAGDSIQVTVQVKQGNEWVAYSPFTIRVAPER